MNVYDRAVMRALFRQYPRLSLDAEKQSRRAALETRGEILDRQSRRIQDVRKAYEGRALLIRSLSADAAARFKIGAQVDWRRLANEKRLRFSNAEDGEFRGFCERWSWDFERNLRSPEFIEKMVYRSSKPHCWRPGCPNCDFQKRSQQMLRHCRALRGLQGPHLVLGVKEGIPAPARSSYLDPRSLAALLHDFVLPGASRSEEGRRVFMSRAADMRRLRSHSAIAGISNISIRKFVITDRSPSVSVTRLVIVPLSVGPIPVSPVILPGFMDLSRRRTWLPWIRVERPEEWNYLGCVFAMISREDPWRIENTSAINVAAEIVAESGCFLRGRSHLKTTAMWGSLRGIEEAEPGQESVGPVAPRRIRRISAPTRRADVMSRLLVPDPDATSTSDCKHGCRRAAP